MGTMAKMIEQSEGTKLVIQQEETIDKFRETIDILHKKQIEEEDE